MAKPDLKREQSYVKVSTNENDSKALEVPLTYGFGVRHTQLILMFTCLSIAFLARSHLGVTIVAMTKTLENANKTKVFNNSIDFEIERELSAVNLSDTFNISSSSISWSVYKEYEWSKPVQEMALGSFFVGYCIMMFPIGLVCQKWGGKLPFQISMFVNGVVSILTPWLVMWGDWKALCVCRIAQGLSQAGMLPGIQTMVAHWVSKSEKASLSSYVYAGITAGSILGFQLGGILAGSVVGWPGTFWVIGVICLVCFLVLTVYGAESPAVHKTITEEEKAFINGFVTKKIQMTKVPWKEVLKSTPVWAIITTHAFSGMGFVFLFTQLPTYLHYILGINVKQSGILSSLPYVCNFVTSISFGIISDFLTNRNIISNKNARRIFNSFSQFGMALMLVCASFANSQTTAILCLVLAMGCNSGIHCGWMINIIDIAPNFAGTLMAFGNTIMNIGNVTIPIMISNIVVDVRDPMQWRVVMFLIAGVAAVSNIIFVVFLSTDVQPWNNIVEDYEKDETAEPVKNKVENH